MQWKFLKVIIFITLFIIALNFINTRNVNNKSKFSASISDSIIIENKKTEIRNNEKLSDMIGQMLIVGFRGTELYATSGISVAIKELNLGGVILFDRDTELKTGRNIVSEKQLKDLIDQLQNSAELPLFISIDVEGGKVNRLKKFLSLPSQKEVAVSNSAEQEYSKASEELKGFGINLNFAPVVDLEFKDNPIIGDIGRAFDKDPNIVLKYAQVAIDKYRENNIISCVKHYPGQGSAVVDNHKELADITDLYIKEELIPYQLLDMDMVMVSHVIDRNIDSEYPVSLSKKHNTVLRKYFNGVCITDDLLMGVVNKYGLKQALVLSINSGCDIMLLSNNLGEYDERLAFKAFDAIFEAVLDGDINIDRIIEAYGRITALKKELGIDQ